MGNIRSKPQSIEQLERHGSRTRASSPPQAFDLGSASVSGTPQPVEEIEICSDDIDPGPPEYSSRRVLMRGGLGLMEPPEVTQWQSFAEIYLMENRLTKLPEDPQCPVLLVLFLNRNYKLGTISPSFFHYMPALEILNLSRTRIKSLPESLFRLSCLKRLFLNHCKLLMVLPPKIGELKQLEVLDLEGTEIMDLPKEVAKLTKLTCLEVSFCPGINWGTKSAGANALIPQGTISALSQLEELSIDVNPEDERWESVVEAIVDDVCGLISLDTLKLYLPRVEHLRKFKWFGTSEVSRSLSRFKFIVGSHDERIMSCLPVDLEFEIERWDRSLKYVNGVGVPRDIQNMLRHTTAFFLDRHMDVAKLSDFGIENMEQLKCCIIAECNQIKVIVDGIDVYDEADRSEIVLETGKDDRRFLKSLEYLYVYRMKSLSCIYEGPLHRGSLSHLKCLALVTCPRLTTIFTPGLLENLDSLEELKVEDCPLVSSLVTCEDTSIYESIHFLPNLKRISLFSLPELISISNGLRIAPNLERMSKSDCPNLKSPSTGGIYCNHLTGAKANLEQMSISDSPNLKSPSTDGICCTPLTWTKANLEQRSISDSPNLKSPSTDGICCTPLTWTKGGLSCTQGSIHSPTALSPSVQPRGEKCRPVSLPASKSEGDIVSSPHLKAFAYSELKNATRNFRNDNLLGEGGFGCMYKGWLDEQTLSPKKSGCGMVVAIKKLKPEGFQGHKEWLAEVNYLGQLHHPNLVKLIGYCLRGDNRLLVYEFMPGGSLENHLFRTGAQLLSWATRIKVAVGAARGLSFLHETEQIAISPAFKASNILLDLEYNAKLSDFGLSKAGPPGDRTHVSTEVMETKGYVAPEYIATAHLTVRSDVYSFGVVLLELLSGRRAVDTSRVGVEQNLVEWAKPYLSNNLRLLRIMDGRLARQYPMKGASMAAFLALECIGDAKCRPSMTEVLARLEKIPVLKESTATARQEQQLGSSSLRLKSRFNTTALRRLSG